MTVAPTLHTFDPQIAGTIGLNIDAPSSGVDQILWYVSPTSGGPYTQIAVNYVHTGLDGLMLVCDSSSARYCVAKVHDSTGNSANSNEVSAVVSAGPPPPPPPPPPLTAQQDIAAALGRTVNVGDQVAWSPAPAVVKTVQADGSLA